VKPRLVLLTLALLLVPTAVASGAPDHAATLDAEDPTFTWSGSGTGVPDPSGFLMEPGFRCTEAPALTCDYALFDVATPGELTVTVESTGSATVEEPTGLVCGGAPCASVQDLDAYVFESNATGDPIGAPLTTECASLAPSEACTIAVEAGYYVVEVEFFAAVAASYVGTATLAPGPIPDPPPPPADEPDIIGADGCTFTLYYFRDSAARLRPLVPAGYTLRPHPGGTGDSATIAAAAYGCERIEVPDTEPAPGTFTVLSVLVYPPEGTPEGPASSDFYVLWIHTDSAAFADLLASRGLPAEHVPGTTFERPALSLAVRTEVPWSSGPYALATTGYHQDVFHSHDNSFLHVTEDGSVARMDFITRQARDHFCYLEADDDPLPCGHAEAHAGGPVADLFGASDRHAHNAWDHDPLRRSFFVLH